MPRGGRKHKDRDKKNSRNMEQHENRPDVIVIDDDDDNSNSFNTQVQHLQISSHESLNQPSSSRSTPSWGAGAQGNETNQQRKAGVSGTHKDTSQNASHLPPSLSGFLSFSDNQPQSSQPRPGAFLYQMMPVQATANPLVNTGASLLGYPGTTGLMGAVPRVPVPLVYGGQMVPAVNLQPSVQGGQPASISQGANISHKVEQATAPSQERKWAANLYSTDSEFPSRVRGGHPPGTKIVKDTQPISIRRHHTRGGHLNVNEVNSSIRECAEVLAKAGEHVSMDRLEKMILEKYQVQHFSQLNLQARNFGQLQAAFDHTRLLCKVNSYAHSFVRARSMCTLFELAECMREFHNENLEFDKLGLGPLQAMPVVYELFKFPMDEHIPVITSADIIEHLNKYLTDSDNWRNKVELDDFLEYLVAMYQVESPFSLGVRIGSIPLAIQMLKKSKRDAGKSRRSLLESFGRLFVEDVEKAISKFRECILKEGQESDSPELRVHYASLSPLDAIKEIYIKFEVLAALMQGEGSDYTQTKMKKFQSTFTVFRKTIDSDPLLRQLFHLAITLSVTDVEESATAFLEEQRQPREITQGSNASTSGRPKKKQPSKGTIVDEIMKYMKKCLLDGSLRLADLRRIEEKIVEFFEFASFDELGQGAFLSLLLSNPKIKEILEDCGGAVLGSMSSAVDKARCYHPTFHDLKEFVCQARHAGVTQTPHVASVVCEQFGVKEVKMLGQGSVARLCQAASAPGKHVASQYNCHYEAALCGKACPANQSAQSVGRLGNQSRDKAMAVLTSCPLLDDLGEWSQWHLVFQPEHGDLRDFVAKYGGRQHVTISGGRQEAVSDFMALETAPGKLLKVSSQSSPDLFSQALEIGDPLLAAGHLASIVANSRGIESSPLALLANHVKDKLLSLRAQQGTIPSSSSMAGREDSKVALIVGILMRLPIKICAGVAEQVLLEPLNKVVGAAKSKMAILQACSQVTWQRDRLEILGIQLGVPEWTESLQAKMAFPAHLVRGIVVDELFGETINDDEEEVIEDGQSQEDDDDICELSSDEDANKDETSESSGENENGDDDENEEQEDEEVKDELNVKSLKVNESDGEIDKDDEEESEEKEVDEDQEESGEVSRPLTREELCHNVVKVIRREEFGVGVELNEEAAKLMKTQQERQGRSLNRLSRDLYSKDTHFVLELIQNADDNTYNNTILPTLSFVIDATGVIIQNNELGFEERNIRALCDVGKSTKSKHVLGYIGQKGIGFKSVFRVTDRPEIHSNGFHICFDVKSGPMGYIMPHWIEAPPLSSDQSWQTQILLPWTDTIKGQVETHAARFNDIQPSLLLFLHRLREITITNKVEGCEMRMSRKDLPTGEVQISHTNGMDRWLVVRKVLDCTQVSVEAKSGADVQSTEIALAFPLKSRSHTISQSTRLGQLPVFAFLPLQSYGFRFIVQGDFNVPSSRESVDKDSCWNQWLRDRIPLLFLQAWDSFLTLPDITPMEAFIHFLQFIPLEGEVMGFFSPITSQIRSLLMAKDCMPVVGTSGNKDDIMWKSPSKTVMTERSLVRDIISPQLLRHNLGLYYLHWDVLDAVDHGTLHALGVHMIGTDHLLQIGQGISANWDCQGSPEQVVELAKWLACVYCSMDTFKDNSDVITRLAKMRLIPLSDGSLVSTEDMTVFLLTVDASKKSKKPNYDPLQALRQDVNIIHPTLTSTPDPEVNSQVAKLLSRMDIKEMNPHDLLHSHVLPVLKSDAWKQKSKEVLVGYLVCAKQVLFDNGEDLTPLKDIARVVTQQGQVKHPLEDNVHFPVEYDNSVNLPKVFPSVSWTLLSPAYLPPTPSKAEKQNWHNFFSQLGVCDLLCINKVDVPLDHNKLITSPWAQYKDLWQDLPDQFIIEDFACEEFELLTREDCMSFEKMCRLYVLMDKVWDVVYKKYVLTKVKDVSGNVLKENVETSFSIHLKNRSWVPASWVTTATETKREREQALLCPASLYCDTMEVQRLLANTVKYLAIKNNQSSFHRFLQIKSCVQREAVKEALISWGQRSEGKATTPVAFSTSIDHITAVYEFLRKEFPSVEIQALFHDHPVIFIASWDKSLSGSGSVLTGRMMRREEVWWTDDCQLFSKYRESLEKYNNPLGKFRFLLPFYYGREEFFHFARIDRTHNMLHLAQLLKHVTSVCTLEDEDVLHDVLSLISAIGLALTKVDEKQAGVLTQEAQIAQKLRGEVKTFLSEACVFPTKSMKLVGLKDSPMIADSKDWEKMFEGKPGVHFLLLESPHSQLKRRNMPPKGSGGQMASNTVDPECIRHFLTLFEGIQLLSGNVESEEITSVFKPCAQGQKYLHDIVGLLQQFLYFSFPDVYTDFKTNNAGQLKDLIFTEVDKLEVRYVLKDRPDVYELRPENCIVKGNHFYILSKNINNQSEINKEVARYFGKNDEECIREIRNFLSQAVPILEGKSTESMADLLARQRTQIEKDLPEEEEPWEVPLPTVINPQYVPPQPSVEPDESVVYDRQDSAMPLQPSGGSQQQGGESAGIRSWPPRSLADYDGGTKAKPGSKKAVSKFAPPEAPDYTKAIKQIPANFRFENNPEESSRPEVGDGGEPGGGGHGGRVDAGIDGADKRAARPTVSGDGITRKEADSRMEGTERQESVEEDSDLGQSRGKRKLLSESASSEEGESQTPASKRQSLETKDMQNQILEGETQTRMLTVQSGDNNSSSNIQGSGESGAMAPRGQGAAVDSSHSYHNMGQGLLAVPRQLSGGPQDGVTFDRDSRRPYRPGMSGDKMLQFNIPTWGHQPDNLAYTELTPEIPKAKLNFTFGENADTDEIGRWGETLVYDYLQQQMASNDTVEDIIWANSEEEKGFPYDFEVILRTDKNDPSDGGEDGEEGNQVYSVFIEVKTTRTDDKALFEISANQVEFAFNSGERFQIFRVFGAGKDSMRLVRIDNIADRMKNKSVRLMMVI